MSLPTQGPRVLVISGHDPSGGAGVDADQDAVRDLPVELDVVVTANTDQDDLEVRATGAVRVTTWLAQAQRLAPHASAIKLGLLPGVAHVRAAADLARTATAPVVVDPVIASSSGFRFLGDKAVAALREELLATGPILTPNLDEAAELAQMPRAALDDDEGRLAAARALLALGARAVLLKGGHATGITVRDLLLETAAVPLWLEHPRYPGSLRGTGCRLATALAAYLSLDVPLELAARRATDLVAGRIRDAAAG